MMAVTKLTIDRLSKSNCGAESCFYNPLSPYFTLSMSGGGGGGGAGSADITTLL